MVIATPYALNPIEAVDAMRFLCLNEVVVSNARFAAEAMESSCNSGSACETLNRWDGVSL